MEWWEFLFFLLALIVSMAGGLATQVMCEHIAQRRLLRLLSSRGLQPAAIPACAADVARFRFLAEIRGGIHSIRTAIEGVLDESPCVFFSIRTGNGGATSLTLCAVGCNGGERLPARIQSDSRRGFLEQAGVTAASAKDLEASMDPVLRSQLEAIEGTKPFAQLRRSRVVWFAILPEWCVIGTSGALSTRQVDSLLEGLRQLVRFAHAASQHATGTR